MSAAPKNLAASVKARLQNEAARRGDDFNLLLLRYGIERLLFRLSQSAYADRFLLKGAMLFVVWDEKTHRPTRDLDLLGFGPSEKEDLQKLFKEVVTLPVVDDGLVFDAASVRAEEIREDKTYGGVRVRIIAKLGPAEVPVQIDVGVGDSGWRRRGTQHAAGKKEHGDSRAECLSGGRCPVSSPHSSSSSETA